MARRLCFEERVRIEEMVRAGLGAAEAARRLGRHPTTVLRELKRAGPGAYCAEAAQAGSDASARRPRVSKLAGEVQRRLRQRWSPHAISAELRTLGMAVCAESIYRGCYDYTARSGLEPGSWELLPRRRKHRKPRSRCEKAKRSALGDYRPIADRPPPAGGRKEPGHWEGDLIVGRANQTAIATLVERASRHTLVVGLPDGYNARNTAKAVTAALGRQPSHMVKTLTWDQGTEMARWADIEKALGIEVYFCDPRSPWQRPTNEQTNGLLRRWLPKSTDLNIAAVRLAIIEDNLNTMPRRLHQWQSAQTAYTALSCNHQ